MGLRNRANGKYLTQETFGYSLNVTASSLRKKQIFFLLPAEAGTVYIKSNLGRYLYALADGSWLGDAERPTADAVWTIEPQQSGTWALKSRHGFYANVQGETLTAFTKVLPKDRSGEWVVHLAMHPQVNIFNVMRKRYVSCVVDVEKDPEFKSAQLQAIEDIPWGEDALMDFVFFDQHPDGRYGIMAFTGQFLSGSGKLVPYSANPPKECFFLLGFHDDAISLRDEQGHYLSCVGANGVLKASKDKITKDELFQLSDSEPQFEIQAAVPTKGKGVQIKQVSIRSSTEVKADQVTVQDTERFQLEIDPSGSGKVAFKANNRLYFGVTGDGTISVTNKDKGPNEYFTVQWLGNRCKLIANNGKYVALRTTGPESGSNGALVANGNGSDPSSLFNIILINRPKLTLRGQYGFVGRKGKSNRVEVNKANGSTFTLKNVDGGYIIGHIDEDNVQTYWNVDRDGLALSGSPAVFHLEFVERSKFLIKHAETGKYLEGEQAGGFRATGSAAGPNTLWEY